MKKMILGSLLTTLAVTNAFSGDMMSAASTSPINFYTFGAIEGGYTWNDIQGGSISSLQVSPSSGVAALGTTSRSNSGGSARVSVGLLRLIKKSVYFSGEAGWGYYGRTKLTLNEKVFQTAAFSNLNGSTMADTLNGFDVLFGAVYNQPRYDVFLKAGGLMQNSNLSLQVNQINTTNNGDGNQNISIRGTLAQILPEIKIGGTYHINDNVGVFVSYAHAFGYKWSINSLTTGESGTTNTGTTALFNTAANVNLNPSMDILMLGLQYRFA